MRITHMIAPVCFTHESLDTSLTLEVQVPQHERRQPIPVSVSRPHPRYAGLSVADLRGAMSADLAFLEDEGALVLLSWVLGARVEAARSQAPIAKPRHLFLQVLDNAGVIVEVDEQLDEPEDDS